MIYEQLQMSGLPSSASTEGRSPSYRQGFRVSLIALREKVAAIATSVTCGAKLQELSESSARSGSSVRIRPVFSQEAISGTSVECSMTLPRWGIRLAGEYGALATSERRTSGIACSFWRTPMASDGAFVQRASGNLARRWTEQKIKHLSEQVAYIENNGGQTFRETFCTPMALDGERTRLPNSALARHWIKKGGGTNLAEQIAHQEVFPTPTVQDSKNIGFNGSHQFNLHKYVAIFPTPTVSGNYNRKGSSKKAGNGLATVVSCGNGGKLNPTWVEWLMGFPLGWTGCDASGTQ